MRFGMAMLALAAGFSLLPNPSWGETALFKTLIDQREVVASVPFHRGSSKLTEMAVTDLEAVLSRIRDAGCNARLIRIEGFSGREGSGEDNFRLSLNRANAVSALLEQKGISCLVGLNGYGDLHAGQDDTDDVRVEIASYPKMYWFDFSDVPIIEVGEVR